MGFRLWTHPGALIALSALLILPAAMAATLPLGKNIDCEGTDCTIDSAFENHDYEFVVEGAGNLIIKSQSTIDEADSTKAAGGKHKSVWTGTMGRFSRIPWSQSANLSPRRTHMG